MDGVFIYVIPIGIVLVAITIFVTFATRKKSIDPQKGRGGSKKNQAQIMKEANRRLAKDPHDPAGLIPMGEIYFTSKLWEKAYPIYDQLVRLATENMSIDPFLVSLRLGICAVQLKKFPEGISALSMAAKINSQNFDVNYYLGKACYDNGQWDRCVPCFKKALIANPDAEGVYLLLGQALYNSRHFKQCLPCFKRALDEDPTNKEALYDMADAMTEDGHGDKAIKVFMHLRPDPVYGARSCLAAGRYHIKSGNKELAISDYEIGLKHESASQDIRLELMYNLSRLYFETNDISKGLAQLKAIRNINMNYKDVNALISRYQELSQNTNLQVYLGSNNSDFVALCRKFIATKYKGNSIKFHSIDVDVMFVDVLAEVYNTKWEDVILFRFFRTNGSTGEMYIREFHSHMQDVKASRGYCITAGNFSEECHKYIEGRSLDLIEKMELTKVLKQIQI